MSELSERIQIADWMKEKQVPVIEVSEQGRKEIHDLTGWKTDENRRHIGRAACSPGEQTR
jgi:desulfoferrodoxin (superoxide reductase-like protein)